MLAFAPRSRWLPTGVPATNMLLLLEESWVRVQSTLRERVGAATYDAWLARLRPVLLERGTIYLEADSRLVADRVRTLFVGTIAEVLSADIGTELRVEVQALEVPRFDALEVSPQHPVVDDANRTAYLALESLLAAGDDVRLGAGAPPWGGRAELMAAADAASQRAAAPRASSRALPANLVFLHGPSGVGKTFLLRWWREQRRDRPIWFDLPALLLAFQAVNHEGRVEQFAEELCAARPLVVDEVHRIAHKPALQQFLLRVLRRREALAAPTMLASRWHPKEVRDLDPSLCTSWLAGFVAALGRPGALGRLRYLRALEGAPSRNGRAAEVESLAQQVVGSYPELRAAWAAARGMTLPPKYLELIDPARVFARVRDRVATHFAVSTADLCGKGQGRAVSRARKVMALLCQQQGLSGGEIGRFLGRTRAAVSYMLLTLQRELEASPELRSTVEELA